MFDDGSEGQLAGRSAGDTRLGRGDGLAMERGGDGGPCCRIRKPARNTSSPGRETHLNSRNGPAEGRPACVRPAWYNHHRCEGVTMW